LTITNLIEVLQLECTENEKNLIFDRLKIDKTKTEEITQEALKNEITPRSY